MSIALNIDTRLDKEDLCGDKLYIEMGQDENFDIIEAKRIGIGYAKEATNYPYRFYIDGNPYVSKV